MGQRRDDGASQQDHASPCGDSLCCALVLAPGARSAPNRHTQGNRPKKKQRTRWHADGHCCAGEAGVRHYDPGHRGGTPPTMASQPSHLGKLPSTRNAMPYTVKVAPRSKLPTEASPRSICRTANAASKTAALFASAAAAHVSTITFNATPSTPCTAAATAKLATAPSAASRAQPVAGPRLIIQDTRTSAPTIKLTPASCVRWLATHSRSAAYSANAAGASFGSASNGCKYVPTSSSTAPASAATAVTLLSPLSDMGFPCPSGCSVLRAAWNPSAHAPEAHSHTVANQRVDSVCNHTLLGPPTSASAQRRKLSAVNRSH